MHACVASLLQSLSPAGELIQCFRERSSLFGSPCQTEQKAFWDCYQRERVGYSISLLLRATEKLRDLSSPTAVQGEEGTVIRAAVTNWLQKRKASSQKVQTQRQKES